MPSLIPLDSLLGAAFVGIIISTAIYGITVLQVYNYFTKYCARDHFLLKTFVVLLFILDTFHVVLLAVTYYYYSVTNFGDYVVLERLVWSIEIQIPVGSFLSTMVQIFFAYRVYTISSQRIIIPVIITVLSLVQLAFGITHSVFGMTKTTTYASVRGNLLSTTGGLAADLVADILITASMIYYLLQHKTGFTRTNRAVNLLITYALNTCFLTTISTMACLILFCFSAETFLYTTLFFILVRLYSCSFMSTLNTRESLRADMTNTEGVVTLEPFSSAAIAPGSSSATRSDDSIRTKPFESHHENAGDTYFRSGHLKSSGAACDI